MTVQFDGVVIDRHIEDVVGFVSEMENGPLRRRTVQTIKDSDGPIALGTVFSELRGVVRRPAPVLVGSAQTVH
jgi:hypothetical protein